MIDRDEAQLRFDSQLAELIRTMSDLGMQEVQFSGVQWEPRNLTFSIKFHTTGLREPIKPRFNLDKLCADAKTRLHNSIDDDIYELRKHVRNSFADAQYDTRSAFHAAQRQTDAAFERIARMSFGLNLTQICHDYEALQSLRHADLPG